MLAPLKVPELLYISVRTIETHRANIMRTLGLTTRAGLVRYAIAAGLSSRAEGDGGATRRDATTTSTADTRVDL